jgi:conjugal transfer/type IV secretion protein DotA/TraY
MTILPRPSSPKKPVSAGAKKQGLLGLLFKPQIGPTIGPLRESTRIFVQLVAGVFAIYKLIPKDYPGLRDPDARLSFSNIISTAWQNIRLTREGAPQAILFFAITGVMAFSAILATISILSLFIGHAHAAAGTDTFTAPSTSDLAQSWINYLFPLNGGAYGPYPTMTDTYGDAKAQMSDPFGGSTILQKGMASALGFYSDAILVVAAIILFYHLTAMVVETAHHGVVMGKRANQIWAPIRLVVAIGLLVPINGGLNSGQFIVIKIAEMGSAMASNAWGVYLTELASMNGQPIQPSMPIAQHVAADIIRMQACETAWNYHVDQINANDGSISLAEMTGPSGSPATIGGISGTKYSYSTDSLADTDICGWYFIPSDPSNPLLQTAIGYQQAAINSESAGSFQTAANEILNVVDNPSPTATQNAIKLDSLFTTAIGAYQKDVNTSMSGLINGQTSLLSNTLTTMQPYGWVMAGAFLNTIDRMQAELATAAADSTPVTSPPQFGTVDDSEKPKQGFWAKLWNGSNDEAWSVRKMVAEDMQAYDFYQSASSDNAATNVACAAMGGLSSGGGQHILQSLVNGGVNAIFSLVDYVATWNGVWSNGSNASCGGAAVAGTQPFQLGVQFGSDQSPLAQMAYLGHANIQTAFDLVGALLAAKVSAVLVGKAPLIGVVGAVVSAVVDFLKPVVFLIALVFWTTGFTLAFLLPIMPFMRFFFAVLSWVGALFEAIIAIPLVALAHLNPEGDGLPGSQARGAYFFVFNLFVRPTLVVFGLIAALIIFMLALSFLNYAYAIAVTGAGGTAFGTGALARLVYSVLYVVILYVCANHAFQLIDHIPQHAMSWMGASGQASPKMGDAGQIEQLGSVVGGYVGAKGMGALGQGVSGGLKSWSDSAQTTGTKYGQDGKSLPATWKGSSIAKTAHAKALAGFNAEKREKENADNLRKLAGSSSGDDLKA